MGQSLVKNYVHIVFSTKHREPFIFPPYDKQLYAYMATICNEHDSKAIQIGGYSDHVHILCQLSRKIPMMTLLQRVKSLSSKWMKTNHEYLDNFFWQNGYGAFSVDQSRLHDVKEYIANQKEHHGMVNYQEEYRQLLVEHDLEWDEKYVWD